MSCPQIRLSARLFLGPRLMLEAVETAFNAAWARAGLCDEASPTAAPGLKRKVRPGFRSDLKSLGNATARSHSFTKEPVVHTV